MSKTLIIAEKPSVATDLARVLGKLPEFGGSRGKVGTGSRAIPLMRELKSGLKKGSSKKRSQRLHGRKQTRLQKSSLQNMKLQFDFVGHPKEEKKD